MPQLRFGLMGFISDANGPNSYRANADDPRACSEIQAAVGGDVALTGMGMSCWGGNNQDVEQTCRSLHNNGVNVCMCDGSVHFISDFVETSPGGSVPGCLAVWDKLNLSNDALPLDSSKY